MLVLTEDEVARCLDLDTAMSVVGTALASYANGAVHAPVRAEIRHEQPPVLGLFMPAYLPQLEAFGQKTVVEVPGNAANDLPVLTATLTLHDTSTGFLSAVIAATHLTNLRTGTIAALAARALAPVGARRAAILGTGGISRSLGLAMARTLGLEQVVVWGRRPEKAAEVASWLRDQSDMPEVTVAADARTAVHQADVIVTATSSREPLFQSGDVGDDALICAMGSNAPQMCEVPPELLGRADAVYADTCAGVIHRAGEVVQAIAQGHIEEANVAELGGVLGTDEPRRRREGLVVVKSCGTAAADIALGQAVLSEARRRSLGVEVDLGQDGR